MRRALLLLSAFALAVPVAAPLLSPAAAKDKDKITDAQALAMVLADSRRDPDRVRDQYRHPEQTLAFCKVKPGQTVVDYMPSSGWFTRILVPYLGDKGRYVGLNPDVRQANDQLKRFFGDLGATFPAKVTEWTGVPAERIGAYNSDSVPDSLKGKVDRVLVMREIHNLWRFGLLRNELKTVWTLLDDDGLLCVEQHRAKPKAGFAVTDGNKGYLREKDVIALIEAHGFDLVAKSEINANKKDPANHPDGVWMLPPNYRNVTDEVQRARLTAIGESDRMTLVFRKRK
jgi:predicted methyltransferase